MSHASARSRAIGRRHFILAAASATLAASPAFALNRGQQWFVDNGLQVMGLIGDPVHGAAFHLSTYQSMGYTAQLWEWNTDPNQLTTAWGRWVVNEASMPPQGSESSHMNTLKHLGLGDEEDLNSQSIRDQWVNWYTSAHANSTYNGVLLWNNNWGGQINDAALGDFISRAHPDMISFDTYPYAPSAQPTGGSPTTWYSNFRQYRQWGMDTDTPVGFYRQTYTAPTGSPPTRPVSQSELSLQTFAGLAFNAKSIEDFTYNFAGTTLFSGGSGDVTLTALGTAAQTMNAEAKRLGPALVKLKPVADPTLPNWTSSQMFIRGKNTNSSTYNSIPIGYVQDPQSAAYTDWTQGQNDPYLTSFTTATNLGTKNLGLPGDVIVSWFRVMDETMDGTWANEKYFMVTNGLADMNATEAETRQSLTMDFNFGASGITQLQRLSRSTGQVEDVNLTSLGGTNYRLSLTLDGGRGDLFKFKDGAPFVGIQSASNSLYWDNDGVAAGNNIGTGAGMGGTGTWNTTLKWYNGTSDQAWAAGSNAVFWGTAGTVTLGAAQSAKNLTFKTNGYTITGSTLTLIADPVFSTITVDSGVTATISSTVAGTAALIKAGPGTLNFTTSNTYSGGTTISGGVLGIVSGSLGTIPGSPTINVWIEQGATLRFNINNLTLPTQRLVVMGTNGGRIDTNGNSSTIAGVISGSTLTKDGAGTLLLTGANTYTGGSTVNAGTLRVNADSGLGAVPGSVTPNITLNGGTLQWGANFDPHNNRAFTFGAAGGTLDTNGFTNPGGYGPVNGFRGSGNLIKTGAGQFYTAGASNTWTGNLIIKGGIFAVYNEFALQATPGSLQAGSVTLDGGTFLLNSSFTTTSANRGITVTANNGTIDTLANSVTWTGPITGSGTLTKISSGTLRLTASNTRTGGVTKISNGAISIPSGVNAYGSGRMEVGTTSAQTGTLNLSGSGSITGADVYVGGTSAGGAGTGIMNITGGSMNLTGWLRIWNTGAAAPGGTRVNFSAGTVSVFGLNTSGNPARWNWTGGTFNLGAGGWLQSLPADDSSNTLSIADDGPMGASLDLCPGKNLNLHGTPLQVDSAGSLRVTGGTLNSDNTLRNDGAFTHSAGSSSLASITGTGCTTATGGTLYTSALNQRSLEVQGNATVRLTAAKGKMSTSTVDTISVAPGATFDLANNALLVHGTSISSIESMLASRAITSSLATADNFLSIGAAPAANVSAATAALWANDQLNSTDTILRTTYAGDANLDGQLDASDYQRINAGYTSHATGWSNGDFDHNRRIDADDYFLLDANSLNPPSLGSGITAVPEPVNGAILLLILCAPRRRRHFDALSPAQR